MNAHVETASVVDHFVPCITTKQAIEQGMSGMTLRAIANSLERKAKNKKLVPHVVTGESIFVQGDEYTVVSFHTNISNARRLRQIAKEVDKHWSEMGSSVNA